MIIHSKIKSYSVEVVDHVLAKRDLLRRKFPARRFFYVIDKTFLKLYQKPLKRLVGNDFVLSIKASEEHKSYVKLSDYYAALIRAGFKKNDVLVTFGGGILQDISGFIASTLYRGVPWVFFPTTLLAQADSCIGSKTSINFKDSKNLIGTFYPPDYIFIDTGLCASLKDTDFYSGVGEIIKFHLLSDRRGFTLLKKFVGAKDLRKSPYFNAIIQSTLAIKKSYFEKDEFDTGRRNLLNYGHTFGHALESASNFAISHGQAVVAGMGIANRLSLKRKLMKPQTYHSWEGILQKFYPRFRLKSIESEKLIHYMKMDKKRTTSDLTAILASDLGRHQKVHDVKEKEVKEVYARFVAAYPF